MSLILKIRRGDSPFYSKIKAILLYLYRFDLPTFGVPFKLLYYVRQATISSIKIVKAKIWDLPVFKALCKEAGRQIVLPHGIPILEGDADIYVGNRAELYKLYINVHKSSEKPILRIGHDVTIGPRTQIDLKKEVIIEDHALIGANNLIMDYDVWNAEKEMTEGESVRNFVMIGENVWTGRNVSILKGVKIGKNSIISANSLVLEDVPENVIAMGVPAKIVLRNVDKFYKDR